MFLFRLLVAAIAIPFRMLSGLGAIISFTFKTFLLGLVAFAAVSAAPGTEGEHRLDTRIDLLKSRIASLGGEEFHAAVEQWMSKGPLRLIQEGRSR